MRIRRAILGISLALLSAPASASPVVLRLATVAPEGTGWARELRAFAREVDHATSGEVTVKWYLGAVAGDELEMGRRIRRGQLDGAASGGPLCEALAPSMRVLRVLGLVGNYREAAYTAGRLRSLFDRELEKSGYTALGVVPLGPHILFTRTPVRSMADFKKLRFWVWDRDDVMREELTQFGVPIVPLPLDQAARAYDQGRIDGFVAPPTVALAFQWSAQARYVTDLKMDMISACMVIANRAFDPLPVASQNALRTAAAKLIVRIQSLDADQDAALLGGLFERQGLTTVPVSPTFSSEFFSLAHAVRDRLGDALVPHALVLRAQEILADFRLENH